MKRMQWTYSDATALAVAYADIFDYPLTEEELIRWMPFKKFIHHLTADGAAYYSLRSVRGLIAVRKKRAAWSSGKWIRAARIARLLRVIPTIRLVGVTGGLAMNNAKQEDDIDLFFVVSSGTLWATRFLVTIIVEIFGIRRKPADTTFADKICLNMFMSERALALPQKERDMFSAHEVLQMVPLWERDGTYRKFLRANQWVKDFLPNAWEEKCRMLNVEYRMKRSKKRENLFGIWHLAFGILEPLARVVQLWYMKKRRTNEIVSGSVIRFHPRDARVWVKQALARRLGRLNIPLDKIFYGR